MATSGTRAFSLDVATAIEEAYELAGLEARTSYDAVTARRSMNIMFADWSNRGIQMWEVTKVELTLTEGTNEYTINSYDIDWRNDKSFNFWNCGKVIDEFEELDSAITSSLNQNKYINNQQVYIRKMIHNASSSSKLIADNIYKNIKI